MSVTQTFMHYMVFLLVCVSTGVHIVSWVDDTGILDETIFCLPSTFCVSGFL